MTQPTRSIGRTSGFIALAAVVLAGVVAISHKRSSAVPPPPGASPLSGNPMTDPPHVIENPVTGERAVFLQMTDDFVRFDLFVSPGGFVADEHIHPHQQEHFVVKTGTIRLRIAGEERDYAVGEEATVPPGTPHVWWNVGQDELHAVVDIRGPSAGRFVPCITSFFALARAGRTDETGNPSLMQSAVILYEYRDVMAAAPRFVQKLFVPPIALLGRLLGYRHDYPYPSTS